MAFKSDDREPTLCVRSGDATSKDPLDPDAAWVSGFPMRLLFMAVLTLGQCGWNRLGAADFSTDVKPVLEKKCLGCHNPNTSKGKVSLATAGDFLGGEKPLVRPGKSAESFLIEVVRAGPGGAAPEMPEEGDPLTPGELDLLREWIDAGADWPEGVQLREASMADRSWWAYQPLAEPEPEHGGIDAYIDAALAEAGLSRNPPASRRDLIRRATYDLTGLPPSPEEVEAFVADEDPAAYARLIDRLLASPRYGERWGRHWLDVVRFGESNGFERNVIINELWPFRDYVIQSLNADRPFDVMIREHLAGDVADPGSAEAAIASAFLVAGPYDNVGNQDAVAAAQIRADTIDEIIRATSGAFLGMTVGCARCHDHKFDPITQQDYYKLHATFAGVRHGVAEVGSPEEHKAREAKAGPLRQRREALLARRKELDAARSGGIDPAGNEHRIDPVLARSLRFTIEATNNGIEPCIDELEIWSPRDRNHGPAASLSSSGDYAGNPIHRLVHLNDGRFGNSHSWIADTKGKGWVRMDWEEPVEIARITWARDRLKQFQDRVPVVFRIEVRDGPEAEWQSVVAHGQLDPAGQAEADRIVAEIAKIDAGLKAIPPPRKVWIGTRQQVDGPFPVFLGGDPQRHGPGVVPGSLSTLEGTAPGFQLPANSPERDRRIALANWLTDPANPLPARVLANRVWQHHFGTGIVDTPNDFGWMGGRPSHPELLDFLARQLQADGWKLKPLHRRVMLSETYRQSSRREAAGAETDARSRLLWRFPPAPVVRRGNPRFLPRHRRETRPQNGRSGISPLRIPAGQRGHLRPAGPPWPGDLPPRGLPPERPGLGDRFDDRFRPARLRVFHPPARPHHHRAPGPHPPQPLIHPRHGPSPRPADREFRRRSRRPGDPILSARIPA